MRDRFHSQAGDAVVVRRAGRDGSIGIGGRASRHHAGVVSVAGEEVIGLTVQRRLGDGRVFAAERVVEGVGRAGEDVVVGRGRMFDTDVIADERTIICPTEEGRASGVGVAGGFVELIFEIEVNAEGDLVQVRETVNSLGSSHRLAAWYWD